MSDISVYPIFNQEEPGVWDDFLRIRIATMLVNYDIPMTAQEIQDAYDEYARDWRTLSHNFAFGAYDDVYMIGYINGAIKSHVAEIFNLYVLPEYQGQKIGRHLLAAADRAVAPFVNKIHLVSWPGAEQFYRQQECQPIDGTKEFTKTVEPAVCCTVPIFHMTPAMTQTCKRIAMRAGTKFSPNVVNREHKPMFINIDADTSIAGFGTFDYDTDYPIPHTISQSCNPQSWPNRRLMYALDTYNVHQMQLQQHKSKKNGR